MTARAAVAVPSADPARLGADERADVDEAVRAVIATGPFIGGPGLDRFERELAAYVGVDHAVGVDNGSNALTLALLALDLPPGGAVLVPPNDGGFAALAVQHAGLVPFVVDVDDASGLVTAATLEAGGADRPAAVIVTHLHGQHADIGPILAWARGRGAGVVEDCAQAHGARRGGAHVGSHGDVATFSFYPTKNLGAFGDGGAVVSRSEEIAERVRLLRHYGWSPRFRVDDGRGRNSRLDPLQAAILSARLPYLDAANEARRAVLRSYRAAAPHLELLGPDDATHVVHHAVVRSPQRDALREHLAARGIGVDVHYPWLVQEMPGIALGAAAATPVADRLRHEQLTLPCFPGMTGAEIGAVCDALAGWRPGA